MNPCNEINTITPILNTSIQLFESIQESVLEMNFNDFFPQGGLQNAKFEFLHSQGLIDRNGYLLKERNCMLPPLKKEQNSIINEFINHAPLTFTRPDRHYQKSCRFFINEFFLHTITLRPSHTVLNRMDLVGGMLRKILFLSKDWWLEIFKILDINLPNSLITDVENHSPHHPPDADIRCRLSNVSLNDLCACTENIPLFLGPKLLEYSSEWIKGGGSFKKFNIVKVTENNSPNSEPHTCFTIASFGEFSLPKISKCPMAFEIMFTGILKREYLFIHDALKLNLLNHLNSQETAQIESDYHFGWQSIIDLYLKVIHVKNPNEVDTAGFLRLISYLSEGWTLPEKDVLEILSEKYLRLEINGQIAGIKKCLNNHHPQEPVAALCFIYNLCASLDEDHLSRLKSYLKTQLINKQGLAAKIHEALCSEELSFNSVNAVIQAAAFYTANQVDISDLNAKISLKRHRGEAYVQLQIAPNFYLLIPFKPFEGILEIKEFFNTEKPPSIQTLLWNIYVEVIQLRNPAAPTLQNPLLSFHKQAFTDTYKNLSLIAPSLNIPSNPFIFTLGYHLQLVLSGFDEQSLSLIQLFPIAFNMPPAKQIRLIMLKDLKNHLALTKYAFICSSFQELEHFIQKKIEWRGFFRFWILQILAQSQDKTLCSAAVIFYKKIEGRYQEKERSELCRDLFFALLPAGLNEALGLLSEAQNNQMLKWNFDEEEIGLKKVLSYRPFFDRSSIEKAGNLLLNFLKRAQQGQKQIKNDSLFQNTLLHCIEKLLEQDHSILAKEILELSSKLELTHSTNQKAIQLWTILSEKFPNDIFLHKQCIKTFSRDSVWDAAESIQSLIPLMLRYCRMNIDLPPECETCYKLLKMAAAHEKGNLKSCDKIKPLIRKHLDALLKQTGIRPLPRAYMKYLNSEERLQFQLHLINNFLISNKTVEAYHLWNDCLNSTSFKLKAADIAKQTEILLDYLIKIEKNRLNLFVTIILDHHFVDLIPYFQTFWVIYINDFLSLSDNNASDSIKETVFSLVFDHEFSKSTKSPPPSLVTFLSHCFDFSTHSKPKQVILSKLAKYGRSVIFTLLFHKRTLEVIKTLIFFDEHHIQIKMGKTISSYIMGTLQKISKSSNLHVEILKLYELCLHKLLNGNSIEIVLEDSSLIKCYRELCAACLKLNLCTHALNYIKKIVPKDTECRYEKDYLEWIKLLAQHNIEEALSAFIILTKSFNNLNFHGLLDPLSEASSKHPSIKQLHIYCDHAPFFCSWSNEDKFISAIENSIHVLIQTDSSVDNILLFLNILKLYPIKNIAIWTSLFTNILKFKNKEILHASAELFYYVFDHLRTLLKQTPPSNETSLHNTELGICITAFIHMLFHNGEHSKRCVNILFLINEDSIPFHITARTLDPIWEKTLSEYAHIHYPGTDLQTSLSAIEFFLENFAKMHAVGCPAENSGKVIIKYLSILFLDQSRQRTYLMYLKTFLAILCEHEDFFIIDYVNNAPDISFIFPNIDSRPSDKIFSFFYFNYMTFHIKELMRLDTNYDKRTLAFIDNNLSKLIQLSAFETELPQEKKSSILGELLCKYMFWMKPENSPKFNKYYNSVLRLFSFIETHEILKNNLELQCKKIIYFGNGKMPDSSKSFQKKFLHEVIDDLLKHEGGAAIELALNIILLDPCGLFKDFPEDFRKSCEKIINKLPEALSYFCSMTEKLKSLSLHEAFRSSIKFFMNVIPSNASPQKEAVQKIYYSYFKILFPLIETLKDAGDKLTLFNTAANCLADSFLNEFFNEKKAIISCFEYLKILLNEAKNIFTNEFLKDKRHRSAAVKSLIFIGHVIIKLCTLSKKEILKFSTLINSYFRIFDKISFKEKIQIFESVGIYSLKCIASKKFEGKEITCAFLLETLKKKLSEIPLELISEKEKGSIAKNFFDVYQKIIFTTTNQLITVSVIQFIDCLFLLVVSLPHTEEYIPLRISIARVLYSNYLPFLKNNDTCKVFCLFVEELLPAFEVYMIKTVHNNETSLFLPLYEQLVFQLLDIAKNSESDSVPDAKMLFEKLKKMGLGYFNLLIDLTKEKKIEVQIVSASLKSFLDLKVIFKYEDEDILIDILNVMMERIIDEKTMVEFLRRYEQILFQFRNIKGSKTIYEKLKTIFHKYFNMIMKLTKAQALPKELLTNSLDFFLKIKIFEGPNTKDEDLMLEIIHVISK